MFKFQILQIEDNPSALLDMEMLISEVGYELLATVDHAKSALDKIYAHQATSETVLKPSAEGRTLKREVCFFDFFAEKIKKTHLSLLVFSAGIRF